VIIAVTSGRFVEQKGHRYLLDAIPTVINRFPSIRFLWLGSGPLEVSLRERAGHLGVSEYVLFAGMCDMVDRYLAASDLMIHPSVEEPFGIAILEGMRAGLPIIASDVGGIPEVVDQSSTVLVPQRDSRALAEKVAQLAKDPDLCRSMGSHGRNRYLAYFGVETMIGRIEQHLVSVIKRERRCG
jgi:glycosyltransferase involved in cell wall biosynthesis